MKEQKKIRISKEEEIKAKLQTKFYMLKLYYVRKFLSFICLRFWSDDIKPEKTYKEIQKGNFFGTYLTKGQVRHRNEDATALVELASKCLQYEARDRPDIEFLFTAVKPLQKERDVASHVLMGITKTPETLPPMLSPHGKACARMDLIAVQDILLKTCYEDEKGVVTELSFHEWTKVQDGQHIKIFADTAFRDKDFRGAIAYYSTAENCMSEWPTTFYMQALTLALAKFELKNDLKTCSM
ncbi:BR-signaling kinase 2 [Abeliophyllum distichum]|uniref:BR-signaling kinase 2 n=1 Tax=Abeliophyllum distichum TaxID=126358 RepID=A0ABD1PAS2_9LAMI